MTALPSIRRWTAADIPDQHGRVAVVTGANSGLGLQTARRLAARGATVVMACRDLAKAESARAVITAESPEARPVVVRLDLGSLASIRDAAARLHDDYDRLDLLINNAGVMWTPGGRTADGFDRQFGINHLGHFALTGLLLDRLRDTVGARIVTVSSLLHRLGRIHFTDLNFEHHYGRQRAYAQSKLANLMFAYALQRRLTAAGAAAVSLAAHPGVSDTELTRHLPFPRLSRAFGQLVFQDPETGALPSLRAATDPRAVGGQYYGPAGWGHTRGLPVAQASSARSYHIGQQDLLWERSRRLTGVEFAL